MKIIVNTKSFLRAVEGAASGVSASSPAEAMQCLRLVAAGKDLRVASCSADKHVQWRVPEVQIEGEGSCIVSAERLVAVCKSLSGDTVAIELNKDHVFVRDENAKFKIQTGDLSKFPPSIAVDGEAVFTISADELRTALGRVLWSVGNAATGGRLTTSGIFLDCTGKTARLVGTDGKCLSLVETKAEPTRKWSGILPQAAAKFILKYAIGEVRVSAGDCSVNVETDDFSVQAILLEGTFPPYRDVLPKDCDSTFEMASETFIDAVRKVSAMVSEETKGVRMKFSAKGLVASARNPDKGEAEVEVPGKLDGKSIEIGFNPAFLMSACKAAGGDEFKLKMSAANRPGLVEGSGYQCVIMPISLTGGGA